MPSNKGIMWGKQFRQEKAGQCGAYRHGGVKIAKRQPSGEEKEDTCHVS